jgi:chemotaxis methyl-accepting protein methylase
MDSQPQRILATSNNQLVEAIANLYGVNEVGIRRTLSGRFVDPNICPENVRNVLTHDTRLDRFPEQNLLIEKYVKRNTKKKRETLIVSSPCSTGEELLSAFRAISKVLNKHGLSGEKVKSLGLDVSPEVLSKALDLVKEESLAKSCTFRPQNFKEGLGLKDEEKPNIILLNNILIHLNEPTGLTLFMDAVEKLDSSEGMLLTTNGDFIKMGSLFGLRRTEYNSLYDSSGRETDRRNVSVVLLKKNNEIHVYELNREGQLKIHLATRTLRQLRERASSIDMDDLISPVYVPERSKSKKTFPASISRVIGHARYLISKITRNQ